MNINEKSNINKLSINEQLSCLDKVEEVWENVWKPICTNKDGSINLDQIKLELYDYNLIFENEELSKQLKNYFESR